MSSLQVAAMANAETLLLARDVAHTTSLSLPDVCAAFEELRATGGHDVLYTVTRSGDDARVLLCRDAQEAERAQAALDSTRLCVYALRRCGAGGETSVFAPRRTRPSLRPSVAVAARLYPLLSRGEAEARAGAPPCSSAAAEESPGPQPLQRKKQTEGPGECVLVAVKAEPSIHREAAPPSAPSAPPSAPPSAAAAPSAPPSAAAAPSAPSMATRAKGQKTLFGAVAGRAKQPRAPAARATSTEPKTKKTREKKTVAAGETTSLARLAKASASSNAVPTAKADLLDEDESCDSSDSCATRESRRMDSALLEDDTPALDIALPAENDDIVLCDDAPPLVFCAPKREREPVAPRDAAGAQPTLSGFLQPEVVRFQRAYTRDTVTETVVVDGEYISSDRVGYRHTETGEVITEQEYYRRSAELMRTLQQNQKLASSPAEEESQAAGKEATGGARSAAARVEKPRGPPVRTLLSYFGKAS